MSEKPFDHVVMLSEIQEERIRGILYSREASRVRSSGNNGVFFKGDHGVHLLERDGNGKWHCDCHTYQRLQELTDCRHIIATERILAKRVSGVIALREKEHVLS